jgi:transcriptional regulator with XRE-family HTH domain
MKLSESKIKVLFGKRVREYRIASGLTQQELADRAGLHRSYIGDIELGGRNVTIQSAEKIAKALNVKLTSLLE